jgi:hypothetical protein
MSDDELTTRVQDSGLQLAWQLFPEDVRAAVALARRQGAVLAAPFAANEEPWPPMQPGERL